MEKSAQQRVYKPFWSCSVGNMPIQLCCRRVDVSEGRVRWRATLLLLLVYSVVDFLIARGGGSGEVGDKLFVFFGWDMPRITSFDFFRKLPKDLTYGTTTGGILSVMVLAILPALLFFECWAFITGEVMTDVVIDPNQEKMLQISFNVTMLELPCQFAEVDAFDFFGSKRLDIEKDIQKSSVTGTMGEKFLHYHYDIPRQEKHPDEMIPRTVVPDDFEIQNLTSANFESTLAVNPFSFVNFHAYWCHWCIIFDPTWKAFAAGLSTSGLPVKAYNIECEDQKELCSKHNIRGYPTLRYVGCHFLLLLVDTLRS